MKNCISRFCLLALLLLMTIAPVRAEIIGQTTENEYIHRLIADNGQELCFVSGGKTRTFPMRMSTSTASTMW